MCTPTSASLQGHSTHNAKQDYTLSMKERPAQSAYSKQGARRWRQEGTERTTLPHKAKRPIIGGFTGRRLSDSIRSGTYLRSQLSLFTLRAGGKAASRAGISRERSQAPASRSSSASAKQFIEKKLHTFFFLFFARRLVASCFVPFSLKINHFFARSAKPILYAI